MAIQVLTTKFRSLFSQSIIFGNIIIELQDLNKFSLPLQNGLSNEFEQTLNVETDHLDLKNMPISILERSMPESMSSISAQLISFDTNAINNKDQNNNKEITLGSLISPLKESNGICACAAKENHQTEEEVEKVERDKVTVWRRLLDTLKWTTKVCYVLCPPIPSLMIRKAAFHPPKHCHYYFLIGGKADNRQHFCDAKRARESTDLTICLPHLLLPKFKNSDVVEQLLRIEVRLITSANDDTLVALYVRCEKSYQCKKSAPYVILFAQPNSSDVGSCMLTDPNLVDIADFLQCDLMAFDYSGFGLSTGTPTEKSVYQNMETVYHYLIEEMRAQPNEIILIGFSMGTAVAIHLASREKVPLSQSFIRENVAGLVLIAPFTSLLRVLRRKPDSKRTCCLDQFSSIDKVSKVLCRTLICHGVKDVIVSINHSVVLQKRLPNATKPFYLDEATHQGIYCERKMWDRVQQFLFHELDNSRKWNGPVKTRRAFIDYNF
uniref:AB hydrolase-1 domain-containing protein n=1 Tax=Wuchereria bancrofti TaxID=6293 RepID=A0AAF5Q424_WUCBA